MDQQVLKGRNLGQMGGEARAWEIRSLDQQVWTGVSMIGPKIRQDFQVLVTFHQTFQINLGPYPSFLTVFAQWKVPLASVGVLLQVTSPGEDLLASQAGETHQKQHSLEIQTKG